MAHLPLASHPDPKNVLVVGGGDGGVIREVLKHKSVEKVTLVDIDEVSHGSTLSFVCFFLNIGVKVVGAKIPGCHPCFEAIPPLHGSMLRRLPSRGLHRRRLQVLARAQE